MKHRMLIVLSHDTVLRAEGHRERLLGIVSLLRDFELAWLAPTTLSERDAIGDAPLFTFNEPAIAGLKIPYLIHRSGSFQRESRRAIESFAPDIVLCDLPWGAEHIAISSGLPVVYLSHGVERDFTDTTLLHLHLKFFPLTVVARAIIGWIERRACKRVALTIAMSSADLQRYRELYGAIEAIAIAQPIALTPPKLDRATSRARLRIAADDLVCAFHGSWHHVPNRIAVEALRRSIAPEFQGRRVHFLLAGTGMDAFSESNLTSLGFVHDLDTFLATADLAVLPILHGAGVRMKTFDYVRAGIPIVATSKAIEGVGFVDGVHAAISANDLRSFTSRLAEAIEQRVQWPTLSANALSHTARAHDPRQLSAVLGHALERCLLTKAPVGENALSSGG